MKQLLLIALTVWSTASIAQTSIISWNAKNLGKSKDSLELAFMASVIHGHDIAVIQEVVASGAGVDATQRLTKALNRIGGVWVNLISARTTGRGSERYAYIFNAEKVFFLGRSFLFEPLADSIDREPYIALFESDGMQFGLVNFHAVPTSKHPEDEVVQLIVVDSIYKSLNLIFMGDFNLDEDHWAWGGLKAAGYTNSLDDVKTSLKRKKTSSGDVFSQEYDNFFYETGKFHNCESYVINFTTEFETLKAARYISDHCPIVLKFENQ